MNYQLYIGSVNHRTNSSGQVRVFRLYSSLNVFLMKMHDWRESEASATDAVEHSNCHLNHRVAP